MNRELLVYVDMAGQPVLCGRLWTRSRPRESSSFEYDAGWLKRRDTFALDPELPAGRGQFHTVLPLFRAFTDPAPDRWGQTLLRRAERARAKVEGRAPRTLGPVDFLTLVDDETRLGALRFKDAVPSSGSSRAPAGEAPQRPFLSLAARPVPPVVALPRLLSATGRILDDEATDDDLALLLAPGTSLGGARPKASVRDTSGALLIAKFPRKDDEWPITRWEATALALAKAAGIRAAEAQLRLVARRPVLMLVRFDRRAGARAERIPFMSAMTALSANDGDPHSYLEIVEALRRNGARVTEDLQELWRRMVFNVLVSNTDDHLRNHGLLRVDAGWRLAPAYDLNPLPTDVKPRVHALAINEEDTTSSIETAFSVAQAFGIARREAGGIARETARVVRRWRSFGAKAGLKPKELDRMESAFEHHDLELAARG